MKSAMMSIICILISHCIAHVSQHIIDCNNEIDKHVHQSSLESAINFHSFDVFQRLHKSRYCYLKVFKQARSRIHSIGYKGKYLQMILRSIIGNEVVFALNHYSDKVCVVFLSGCEPVDVLVVCLYRYCRWRSNYKSWVGM